MIVKLLIDHHLEFLSLKGGCRGSSESTLVKTSNCWKSHAAAQINHSSWVFTLWKRLEHQVLGFTVSISTLNCMQTITSLFAFCKGGAS